MSIIANINYYWNLLDSWTVAPCYESKIWKGNYFVDRLGDVLQSISRPSPPHGLESLFPYLPPDQTAAETIFWCVFGSTLAYILYPYLKNYRKKIPEEIDRNDLSWSTTILKYVVIGVLITLVIHKFISNKLPYLLMPCHWYTAAYLVVFLLPRRSQAEFVFNIILHYHYTVTVAAAFPDTASHTLLGELLNFWIQHILLSLMPYILIVTRQYELYPNRLLWLFYSWSIYVVFKFAGQMLPGMLLGFNIGYFFIPPPSPFQALKGESYRSWFIFLFLFLGFVLGTITMTATYYLVAHRKGEHHDTRKHAAKHELKNETRILPDGVLKPSIEGFGHGSPAKVFYIKKTE